MLSISAIDPCNRTGKISIPANFLLSTRGSDDFLQGKVKDLSLCLLFQRGQCKAGSKCHQIHADPCFVLSLREQAASGSNCCAAHGDVNSTGFLQLERSVAIFDASGAGSSFSLSRFGRTQLLDNYLRATQSTCRVPASKICRLHTQGRCKFGRDCKNIHFCRDPNVAAGAAAAAAPIAAAKPPLPRFVPRPEAASFTPPRKSDPLDIEDDESCGISTRSCSVYSTPGKATHLAPVPFTKPVELKLCAEELLLKPLKAQISPSTTGFCFEGFETSIRSLCDDVTCAELETITSPIW